MRRLTWVVSCLMVVGFCVAADEPDPAGKKAPAPVDPKAKAKVDTKAKAKAKAPAQSKIPTPPDPRATSLFASAQNLEKAGKKPGAIALYRDVLIKYPDCAEAPDATARLKALGGKIPAPSEIKPAPPPEKAKFTRAPKPKYASQSANRAALNQGLNGLIDAAASQPATGGGGGVYGK